MIRVRPKNQNPNILNVIHLSLQGIFEVTVVKITPWALCVFHVQNRYHEGGVYHPPERELGAAVLCNPDSSNYILPETKLTASFSSKFLQSFVSIFSSPVLSSKLQKM